MHQLTLDEAKKRLFNGQLVIFPTETVYGIGANAYNKDAIKSIYEIKKRPTSNPLICHFANIEDIERNFIHYVYKIMGLDSRFLKYDINVDKSADNNFSVIIGPMPKSEAHSMIDILDIHLSFETKSTMKAELICNEEVILMCEL